MKKCEICDIVSKPWYKSDHVKSVNLLAMLNPYFCEKFQLESSEHKESLKVKFGVKYVK